MSSSIELSRWSRSPGGPLSGGSAHFWQVRLDRKDLVESLVAVLSVDELAKMQRYHHERDRNRFAIARGALRHLLGHYLGMPAGDVEFGYGTHGKPYVQGRGGETSLGFNISHSGNLAVMGFALGREIGVDIEEMRDGPDIDGVSAVFMSPTEVSDIKCRSGREKKDVFYRYWVCKEAYLKVRATGMTLPSRSFSISLAGESPTLLSPPPCDPEPTKWIWDWLDVPPGFCGAFVCSGPPLNTCESFEFGL